MWLWDVVMKVVVLGVARRTGSDTIGCALRYRDVVKCYGVAEDSFEGDLG